MPVPLPALVTYRASIIVSDVAQTAVLNRYYLTDQGGGNPAGPTDQQLCNAIDTLVAAPYKALINNTADYRGVVLQRVSGALPYEIFTFQSGTNGPGIAGATAMAKQTAGLISLYTGFQGKRFAGRQFVPFPATADDQGAGVPTASYGIRLATLATALLQPITLILGGFTVICTPVSYSRDTGATSPFLTATPRTRWATQRRRGDFGRANASPI